MIPPTRPGLADDPHPDTRVLARYIEGRLDSAAMTLVEQHVAHCEVCCRTLLSLPEDRLSRILRLAGPAR